MSETSSRGGTGRVPAEQRARARGVRLLLAGATVAALTTVTTAGDAAAAPCPPGVPSWMPCQASGFPTPMSGMPSSPWSWWTSPPVSAPPVSTPPVTVPPVAVPPVTVPPVTVPPVPVPPPLPRSPQVVPDAARQLLDLVNQERLRAGLTPIQTRDDVTAIALAHSRRMAEAGDIFHNRGYFSLATRRLLRSVIRGENVAYNGSIENAHARLMRSPAHRANLLDRRFTVAGFAVVQAPDGRYFITQNLFQPARPARRAR